MLVEFDLKLWKPDDKILTRDSHPVRIVCTDYKGETGHSIIGLVKISDTSEACHEFMSNGKWLASEEKSDLDLMVYKEWRFEEGDLVINRKTWLLLLVAHSDDPRILESTISIDPSDLSKVMEENFDPDDFELAFKEDWEDFEYYLALLGLVWRGEGGYFRQIKPELDFTPLAEGWEVTYKGRSKRITDEEYKSLRNED